MSELQEVVAEPIAEILPSRITSRMELFIERALEKHSLNDEYVFDIQFAMTDQGPQAALVFFLRGPVMGTMISAMSIVDNPPMITEGEVEEIVKSVLEGLRAERSKFLAGVQA